MVAKPFYDYAPTAMVDGVYRMWWCGGIAGDHIFYSQSASLEGPWSTPQIVLYPQNSLDVFDRTHVCDPSVIRVNGIYYMYYGGQNTPVDILGRIGVATSTDGINWVRANGGLPIILPRGANAHPYGAGQPSALYLDGYFYLLYTDTTGEASNPATGGGIYVIRSPDPTFQTQVEALIGPNTYSSRTWENVTDYRFMDAASVDWMYTETVGKFVVALNATPPTGAHFFVKDREISASPSADAYYFQMAGTFYEGMGLVRRPDGHAPASSACGTIPVDVFRSVGTSDENSWDLAWTGLDVYTGLACSDTHLDKVLDSYLMASPGLPLALVVNGQRLQFQSAAPAQRLSKNYISVTSEMYHLVPYGGSLFVGDRVLVTAGQPHAFEIDGWPLWPIGCANLISDNGSTVHTVDQSSYSLRPKGPPLFCVQ